MLYDILLDIGGTSIKGGFYSIANKSFSDSTNYVSCSEKEKDVIINHICSICERIWNSIDDDNKEIRDIRMAFPGPFDYENGVSMMEGLAKYESLYNVSIPKEMIRLLIENNYKFIPKEKNRFKFVNDVEAYAKGVIEKRGFYNGYKVLYLCIGTGAGSSYSMNGEISLDVARGVVENGWIYSLPYKDSIIDEYISARGINKLAQKYCDKSISPLELSKMCKSGNEYAIRAFKEFGEDLNQAIFPLLQRFGANVFVLGGNISLSSDLYLLPIKESCKEVNIDIVIESDTSKLIMMGLATL